MTSLDESLVRLSAGDRASLDGLEDAVWTRVGELNLRRNANRLRAGTVALALTVGLVNGGVGALASERSRASEPILHAAPHTPLARLSVG
jgi:hypothetical protein